MNLISYFIQSFFDRLRNFSLERRPGTFAGPHLRRTDNPRDTWVGVGLGLPGYVSAGRSHSAARSHIPARSRNPQLLRLGLVSAPPHFQTHLPPGGNCMLFFVGGRIDFLFEGRHPLQKLRNHPLLKATEHPFQDLQICLAS